MIHQADNLTLRGVGYVLSPYLEECVRHYPRNCSNPGIDTAALYRILSTVGITLTFEVVTENETLNMLKNGSADIAIQTEASGLPRFADRMDQTASVTCDRPVFIVKKNVRLDSFKTKSLSRSLEFKIWAASILLIVLSSQLESAMQYLLKNYHSVKTISSERAPKFKHLLVCETVKYVSIVWLVVQIGIYGGSLSISFATRNVHTELPFKNFDELSWKVLRNECNVYTFDYMPQEYPHIFPEKNTTAAVSAAERRIMAGFKLNPPIIMKHGFDSDRKMVETLLASHVCVTVVDYESRATYWQLFSNQILSVLDMNTDGTDYVYFFRKGLSPYLKNLIQSAFVGGSNADLYSSLVERDVMLRLNEGLKINQKLDVDNEFLSNEKMSIWDLQEVFTVLLIGNLIAGLVFLAEHLWHSYHLQSNNSRYPFDTELPSA